MLKYHDTELKQEISAVLDRLQEHGEPMRPQWVAHEVCDSHRAGLASDTESVDVAFWTYTGYTITRKFATECINGRDTALREHFDDDQQLLPYDGYVRAHMQDYYVAKRDGEDVGVPTRDLTDDEIDAKVSLYRSQSRKLVAHAAELERYKDWRRAQIDRAS